MQHQYFQTEMTYQLSLISLISYQIVNRKGLRLVNDFQLLYHSCVHIDSMNSPLIYEGVCQSFEKSCGGGGLSIEGEHCFSLMMYVFCSKNSLYSANFLFIMFNFLLNSSVNLVLLIKPACYELYTFLDPVFCNPEDVLNTIWKLYSFNERNLNSFQVLCSH